MTLQEDVPGLGPTCCIFVDSRIVASVDKRQAPMPAYQIDCHRPHVQPFWFGYSACVKSSASSACTFDPWPADDDLGHSESCSSRFPRPHTRQSTTIHMYINNCLGALHASNRRHQIPAHLILGSVDDDLDHSESCSSRHSCLHTRKSATVLHVHEFCLGRPASVKPSAPYAYAFDPWAC